MTQQNVDRGPMRLIESSRVLYAGLFILWVLVWWSSVHDIDLAIALKGYSPIGWVYQTASPDDFASNFFSGVENYGLSAFMQVYTLSFQWLGVPPEHLLPLVIAFEIAVLGWAAVALCRCLAPDAPAIVSVLVVALMIASPTRDLNFAHFAQPFFVGQYYNVADALRIFGLVMVLRGRPLPAAALLAGSFITHPTMGLMGLVCAAAMQLVRPREMLKLQYLAAAALFFLIAGGWLLLQFRTATMSGGQIPAQEWIDLTRAFSFHWYPVDDGMLTTEPQEVLLPFLSFLLLLAYYWPGRGGRSEVANKALVGMLSMLGLSIAGLAISATVPVPFLIKLALQRGNDLVIVIGLIYVVAGLWRDLQAEQWWRRGIAAAVLVSPCVLRPEFPLLWSIVLVSPGWLRVLARERASVADWIVAVLATAAAVLGTAYLWTGIAPHLKAFDLSGGPRAILLLGAFLLLGACIGKWNGRRYLQGAVITAVLVLASVWLREKALDKVDIAEARDYMQAQLWARDNTLNHALFMPDPTIYYGWRDYSRRSSFGNLREWLHTSWIYDSNFERYQDGMRRFREFDIDLAQYIHARPPIAAMNRLSDAVKQRYYGASDEWRTNLAQRYAIDYFLFQRKDLLKASRLPVVYQNEHFVICAARK